MSTPNIAHDIKNAPAARGPLNNGCPPRTMSKHPKTIPPTWTPKTNPTTNESSGASRDRSSSLTPPASAPAPAASLTRCESTQSLASDDFEPASMWGDRRLPPASHQMPERVQSMNDLASLNRQPLAIVKATHRSPSPQLQPEPDPPSRPSVLETPPPRMQFISRAASAAADLCRMGEAAKRRSPDSSRSDDDPIPKRQHRGPPKDQVDVFDAEPRGLPRVESWRSLELLAAAAERASMVLQYEVPESSQPSKTKRPVRPKVNESKGTLQCLGMNRKKRTRCRNAALMEYVGPRPLYCAEHIALDPQAMYCKCNLKGSGDNKGCKEIVYKEFKRCYKHFKIWLDAEYSGPAALQRTIELHGTIMKLLSQLEQEALVAKREDAELYQRKCKLIPKYQSMNATIKSHLAELMADNPDAVHTNVNMEQGHEETNGHIEQQENDDEAQDGSEDKSDDNEENED
eukprot:c16752_g1_i2.p1 GENE.c16752_g1_i2~~c16752_g1_i2.p1  ORF type:complete len:483 (+),score=73.83 c16752_g1_i2:75-1451(+)